MKLKAIRITLSVLGMLTAFAVLANAQAAPAAQDIQIKTTKIAGNLYTLEGQGGMTGALVGPDGVLLVDTQFAPMSEKILAAVKTLSSSPVRFVVNTHLHGDHTGGNENLGKTGAVIVARDKLRERLARPAPAANGTPGVPMPAAGLPLLTYDRAALTFHMNGEEVRAVPIPFAHTDGDTLVHFATSDVIMTGDFYRSAGYPNIDRNNGGSLQGMIDGLGFIVGLAGPNTKIIPGHGATVDRTAVTAHRDLILALRDRVAPLVKQGKTVQEVTAAKLTAEFDSKVIAPGTTGDRFIGQLYAEIKGN